MTDWTDWLGPLADELTTEQREIFDRLADRVEGHDAEDGAAVLSGMAQIIAGDGTVTGLGREWREAKQAERAAMRRLHGGMIAADAMGVPQTRIAPDAGVARDTVRRALGLLA